MPAMKVTVDPIACEANALCTRIAPQVFAIREDDAGDDVLDIAGDGEVPAELADRVANAVKRCPKTALTLQD
jgi:ferredoxin